MSTQSNQLDVQKATEHAIRRLGEVRDLLNERQRLLNALVLRERSLGLGSWVLHSPQKQHGPCSVATEAHFWRRLLLPGWATTPEPGSRSQAEVHREVRGLASGRKSR